MGKPKKHSKTKDRPKPNGRPKQFDEVIHLRLDFMQKAFLIELANIGGITISDALRAVIEHAMQDVLDARGADAR
ncbi:hypothetical protein [Aeromicrobium sp. HA]|uniref:hypothetical protein n=1 Tax=Aeromicrobium sp. HA TaxID=3009077 RepID=UPI0022B0391F|nr:hypothetical protein [Aeromicrobium sp. HA]